MWTTGCVWVYEREFFLKKPHVLTSEQSIVVPNSEAGNERRAVSFLAARRLSRAGARRNSLETCGYLRDWVETECTRRCSSVHDLERVLRRSLRDERTSSAIDRDLVSRDLSESLVDETCVEFSPRDLYPLQLTTRHFFWAIVTERVFATSALAARAPRRNSLFENG